VKPRVSVVVPVYNESETLHHLLSRLVPALDPLTRGSFEIIFVDDGSTDGSADILDGLHAGETRVKVVHFSRNFGHQAALQAGLDEASGEAVVLMDADLQDPPELLQAFLDHWTAGYDVVYAIRTGRKESLLMRAAYRLFYRSLRAVATVDIPLDAGDFCLLDRRVVDILVSLPERHRLLRGLRSWVGFRHIGIECERNPRYAGTSKYSMYRLIELALAGYVGFSTIPLRLATLVGLSTSLVGFVIAAWAIGTKLLGIPSPRGWASLLASVMVIGGIQLLVLGVIGEYLSRVYDETRRRPLYIVSSRVGLDTQDDARHLADGARHRFPRSGM